jgi:hypothetical protein
MMISEILNRKSSFGKLFTNDIKILGRKTSQAVRAETLAGIPHSNQNWVTSYVFTNGMA